MSMKGVEIKVYGQVQGVFFRQGVKDMAEKFGLTGWVSNEDDGSVKIMAEGEEENLQKLIEWCKTGTREARVDSTDVSWNNATNNFDGFQIVP